MDKNKTSIDTVEINVKNPDKVYFAEKNITKGDIIDYYVKIAPFILPHLVNRPFSMLHFPEGLMENMFYQKERPQNAPRYLGEAKIPSDRRGFINWSTVDNVESLIYMANRSVVEMHAWFSRADDLRFPDIAVVDLDPSGKTGFKEAAVIAGVFRRLLEDLNIYSVPKTTGSRGIHIYIPIAGYSYDDVRVFLIAVCAAAQRARPDLCTTERTVERRGNRVYLDAVQCAWGKTLAVPYSMRVRGRGAVSTPLKWEEVGPELDPLKFDINTIFDRIGKHGDLFEGFYGNTQSLYPQHYKEVKNAADYLERGY